jgi:CubicO group peptidase (beta-lactamase class C family)
MANDTAEFLTLLQEATPKQPPAVQMVVWRRGEEIFSYVGGWLDPETRERPTQGDTLFDLASVTKLFTATAFARLCDAGRVAFDQSVSSVLPEFSGRRAILPYEDPLAPGQWIAIGRETGIVEAGRVTFRHLLTHTSGLPAWRPLFRQADAQSSLRMALETHFSYPTGAHIVYSDIGLILLGLAVERLTESRLDEAIEQLVLAPIGLRQTRFCPLPSSDLSGVAAPTEYCAWRRRRIVGQVHDENAYCLGGVAGHAGLFSTAADVARLGQLYLDQGGGLLAPQTVAEMTRQQAAEGDVRRGVGFALWSPDSLASSNPFSSATFGHTGFTGTSLWIDPQRELVVAVLTNEVYYGREKRGIAAFRVAVHQAIVDWVDGKNDDS